MVYVCLWSPAWATGGGLDAELAAVLPAVLAEVAPRIRVEPCRVWVDGWGLPARALMRSLLERLAAVGVEEEWAGAGAAIVPVAAALAARAGAARAEAVRAGGAGAAARMGAGAGAAARIGTAAGMAARAELAAHTGAAGTGVVVERGAERAFLAPLPLAWLEPDPSMLALLKGVGITTCGALAELEREAVEVRLGPEGVRLWRLARADDPRLLFRPAPRERPHASLDFVDYVITDPERLVFTANALLGRVCDVLRSRGEHARRMRLSLALANGEVREEALRPGRSTANRPVWLRLVRLALERLTLPDAVAGVHLEVEATTPAAVRQGDLFDPGFATAEAAEAAVLRLLESQGEVVVRPEVGAHPLAERRTRWTAEALSAVERPVPAARDAEVCLTLQLLARPQEVRVETTDHRGDRVPTRYRGRDGWHRLVTVAGPDRISGGVWEMAYAREYYRAVREDGAMLWLFRDGLRGTWYLHGWWD